MARKRNTCRGPVSCRSVKSVFTSSCAKRRTYDSPVHSGYEEQTASADQSLRRDYRSLRVPASAQILKVVVDDTIQPISQEYISRAIDEAHRRNDQAVLIEMNTPGGLLRSTHEIIDKITSSPVPVIVYVTPAGGHAGSAGIFILESADIAVMAPGTAPALLIPSTLIGPRPGQARR